MSQPTWSPDGMYIAFSAGSGLVPGGGVLIDTFRIRPDGTGLMAVTSTTDKDWAYAPHWNPRWVNDLGQ